MKPMRKQHNTRRNDVQVSGKIYLVCSVDLLSIVMFYYLHPFLINGIFHSVYSIIEKNLDDLFYIFEGSQVMISILYCSSILKNFYLSNPEKMLSYWIISVSLSTFLHEIVYFWGLVIKSSIALNRPLVKSAYQKNNFYFSSKTYVVGTQKNRRDGSFEHPKHMLN